MGTLASELGPHAGRIAGQPRLYVDANMPAGLVTFMRTQLQWDVLFVIEHDDLRRARDGETLSSRAPARRTLITLDRDYLDDRKFHCTRAERAGADRAAREGLAVRLTRLDKEVFRRAEPIATALADTTPLRSRDAAPRAHRLAVETICDL